jgi:RimJ/RimL family protein N-acetyltransferase
VGSFDALRWRVLILLRVSTFQPQYGFLSAASPQWGKIALLPWDEEIFGFPVADFQLGPNPPEIQDRALFIKALEDFSARTNAQLISTHVQGDDMSTIAQLVKAGFSPVEFSLVASLSRIKPGSLPPRRLTLREALPADRAAICEIASRAFQFGRYHADPQFPRKLANDRYASWIRNALDRFDPNSFVFVLGRSGEVLGFMDVVICDGHADLRLGAVDPHNNLGFMGFSLYVETLRALLAHGVKSASAKLAAPNTAAMNIYSMLGFQFSKPEAVLHWHAPESSILQS